MKATRALPAIAITLILALSACSDALGPTDQGPDVASVLENQNDSGQDSQGQQGTKRDNPLEQQ